jgi:hypothetical protein
MRAAQNAAKSDTVSFSSLRELIASKPKDRPRPIWDCPPDYMLATFEKWPDILGTAIRYQAADDRTEEEIATLLHQPQDLIETWLAPPPLLTVQSGDIPQQVAAVNHAVAECCYGGEWVECWRAAEWAERYRRPDLVKRLVNQRDRAKRLRDRAEEHRFSFGDIATPALVVAMGLYPEATGLDRAPAERSIGARLAAASLLRLHRHASG